MQLISILFLFAFLFSGINSGQRKIEPYTMKTQLELNIPSNPVISPDGNKILFTIKKADLQKNKWYTQVYLLDVKTKKYRQITSTGENCTNPSFSPNQKWMTYISDSPDWNKRKDSSKDNPVSLMGINMENNKTVPLISLPEGIEEYIWSKNSDIIAILSKVKVETKDKSESLIGGIVYPHKNPDKILFTFDVSKKKLTYSFKLDPGVENISFTPEDEILYQTNYTGEYNDEQKFDIYKVDLKGNKTQLTSETGPETLPSSDDGKTIAYISQTVPDIEFAETDLNVLSRNVNINLTKNFNLSVDKFIWKDLDDILFTVKEGTNEELYQINIKSGKINRITEGNMIISDLSISSQNKDLCYRLESYKTLPEIIVNEEKVTNFSDQLREYNPGSQEVSYKSKDSKFNIEGILFKPESFDSTQKYPLILTVHGGPYGRFQNSFLQFYGTKVFTDNGYLVFAPNPRGSSGYSDKFGQANRYDLGGNDYEDIMSGVDYLISKGFVDTAKIGVTGGSYGGYLTNWIISQNTRFKAAVSMYGIFSLITDWSNSIQPRWEEMYLGYNFWDKPINSNNLYISRSPSFYVKNIKTPTLILHGEKDVETDVSNSREMYQALHLLGIPAEFVIYPRATHGLRDEPDQYLDVVNRSLEWFEKYIPSIKMVKRNYE